jgi:hypothetical protein
MSRENVELVRRALEAFPRGEMEEMLSFMDPECELHSAIVGGAEGNVYRGHEGLRRWYADSFEVWRSALSGASFAISAIAFSPSGTLGRADTRAAWRSTPRWAG